jgi:hypothetical protein
VLRHTALFRLRETTTRQQREAMLRGLASLLEECPTVRGGDYGTALPIEPFAGTRDVALHLDFDDADGYEAYVAHPAHVAVSGFNRSLSVDGTTTRVDWRYEGPARLSASRVRHCEAFVWARAPDRDTLAAATALSGADGVLSALAVPDSGGDPRAADWILDVELPDEEAARAFLGGAAYAEFAHVAAATVDSERTARITHLQRNA